MRSNLKPLLITGLAGFALAMAVTLSHLESERTSKATTIALTEPPPSISSNTSLPAPLGIAAEAKPSENNPFEAWVATQSNGLNVAGKPIGAGGYAQALREIAKENNPELALAIANQVAQCRDIALTTEAAHRFKNSRPSNTGPESQVVNGLVHQAEMRARACQTLTNSDQQVTLELLRYATQNNIRSAATAYYIEAYVQGRHPEHWQDAKIALLNQASAGDLEAMFYVMRSRENFNVSDTEARAMALVLEEFSQRPVDFASPHALIIGRLRNEGIAYRPLPAALEAEAMRRKVELLAAALPPESVKERNAGD